MGAGGGAIGAGAGGATPPGDGGATPSMVPFSCGLGAAGGAPAGAGGAPGAAPAGGAFIINIVPLNLGAAAPFKAKLHFVHVVAVSGFCVPQFGQNTSSPPGAGAYRPGRSLHATGTESQETTRRKNFPCSPAFA